MNSSPTFKRRSESCTCIAIPGNGPVIQYYAIGSNGLLQPKLLRELTAATRQVWEVYKRIGAITAFPNLNDPEAVPHRSLSLFVVTSGALHPQSTCRAGSSRKNSVVDAHGMSHDIGNLMCCDASVIPDHISSNPNALIMALASRASEFVIAEILGKTLPSPAPDSEVVQ